jgi:hypothetical protein
MTTVPIKKSPPYCSITTAYRLRCKEIKDLKEALKLLEKANRRVMKLEASLSEVNHLTAKIDNVLNIAKIKTPAAKR